MAKIIGDTLGTPLKLEVLISKAEAAIEDELIKASSINEKVKSAIVNSTEPLSVEDGTDSTGCYLVINNPGINYIGNAYT